MLRALRLILSQAGRHTELFGAHARARATHIALLVGFGLTACVFVVVLVTVALARWLGTLPALAVMAALAGAACLVVLLVMRAEQRAHAAAQRVQAREDRRVLQTALLTALPGMRRSGLLLATGAGALALTLLAGRRRCRDEDEHRS